MERLSYAPTSPHMSPIHREPFPSAHGAIHEGLTVDDYGPFRMPHERRPYFGDLGPSGHEAVHLALARDPDINIPVHGVSVKRQGNSLGRTIFSGHIEPDKFKVVAAGGTCNTPFGIAVGYGSEMDHDSDVAQIHALHIAYGGMNVSEAIQRAHSKVKSIDAKFLRSLAVIIADMGEIYGEELIERAIRIAKKEAELGIEPFGSLADNAEAANYLPSPESALQLPPGEYTIIEHLVDDKNIIVYVTIDEENNDHILCGFCHGRDGHGTICPLRKKGKDDGITPKIRTIYSASKPTAVMPSGGLIFSRN